MRLQLLDLGLHPDLALEQVTHALQPLAVPQPPDLALGNADLHPQFVSHPLQALDLLTAQAGRGRGSQKGQSSASLKSRHTEPALPSQTQESRPQDLELGNSQRIKHQTAFPHHGKKKKNPEPRPRCCCC